MHWNRFALSFASTLVLTLPLFLSARGPRVERIPLQVALSLAPVLPEVTVGGVRVRTKLVERRGRTAVVRVTAHNPTTELAAVRVQVGLARNDGMPRMARVVQPPRPVAHQLVAFHVEPGDTRTTDVRLEVPPLPKGATDLAYVEEAPPAIETASAATASTPSAEGL